MTNSSVGVALIGAGHWGPNLARNFHSASRSRITWIVDQDAARLAQVASGYDSVKTSQAIDDALADPATTAVAIATPTSTHFELARRALEAGKHVLVEKPLTTSTSTAQSLCDLAAARDLVLMVGHVFLFNAGIRDLRERLVASEIGDLHYLSMVRTNLGPIRTDVNAAWDLAAHDISIANFLLDATPELVSATGGTWINPGVEDTIFATFNYPGNVIVHVHASWLSPEKQRTITAVGSTGMLTFDDMQLSEPVRVYDKGVANTGTASAVVDNFAAFRSSVREGSIVIPKITMNEPLKAQCEAFLDAIDGDRSNPADGPAGREVVRALEALSLSLERSGEPTKVLPG